MLADWQALWKTATARYCASDTGSNPNQMHGVVRYWTVWNEPNSMGFLKPRFTCPPNNDQACNDPTTPDCVNSFAQDYAALVAAADAGRQQGCPNDTKLVVGEVAQNYNDDAFVKALLADLEQLNVVPAVLSDHTYTFAVPTKDRLARFRSYLDNVTDSSGRLDTRYRQTELWLTEAGGPGISTACESSSAAPYDDTCFAKREGFIRSLIQENRQYGAALKWPRTFIFKSAFSDDPTDPSEAYGLIHVDSWGQPLGSNMMFDAVKASCNSPLTFMVESEANYNDDLQSACYAIATNDSTHCSGIAEGNGKQMCLAMAQRSQTPCWSITDPNLQSACLGMSSGSPSNCGAITNANMANFCYGVSTSDYTRCDNITERNSQLLCYAMSDGINSNCGDIPYANDRNFCYGASGKDTSYCASITPYRDSIQGV